MVTLYRFSISLLNVKSVQIQHSSAEWSLSTDSALVCWMVMQSVQILLSSAAWSCSLYRFSIRLLNGHAVCTDSALVCRMVMHSVQIQHYSAEWSCSLHRFSISVLNGHVVCTDWAYCTCWQATPEKWNYTIVRHASCTAMGITFRSHDCCMKVGWLVRFV